MSKNETKQDLRVQLAFFEGLQRRCPEDIELLKVMGDLYTRVGEFEKGLEIDQMLARKQPRDPLVLYNLACSLALVGLEDKALAVLEKAVTHGYSDADWMASDPDLKSLRPLERFGKLLHQLRQASRSPETL